MAATQGSSAFGTIVKMYYSAAWNNVLEPKDVTGPNITAEFIDFTHQQSPSGFRERKPSFKSSGDVSFRCNYVHSDSSHQALINAAIANPPTLSSFRLVYPDNTQFEFSAYVSLQWTAGLNAPEEMTVTLSITANIVVAAPS